MMDNDTSVLMPRCDAPKEPEQVASRTMGVKVIEEGVISSKI